MAQTFVFEELDEATKHYLTEVRDAKGEGAPGLFAPTTTAFPGCSLLAGIGLIVLTPLLTLTDWVDIVYDDPTKVAFLQTAGLLLGFWLLMAYFRTKGTQGNDRTAGNWVYADPHYIYEAYRERVTATDIQGANEARYTHSYNEGKYQHSIVKVKLADRTTAAFKLNWESIAEKFAVFINYLAWARSDATSEAGKLPPASLGAVARYVASHDEEPKAASGTIDLGLTDTTIEEIPTEPTRVGRAVPSILPYVATLVAAAAIFAFMAFIVNPPIRDGAIYAAVMHPPTEPRFLRAYLIDPRNSLYRAEVLAELATHYRAAMQLVERRAEQPQLREGMLKILRMVRSEADQPVVSVRVTERSPAELAKGDSAKARVKKLREGFVGGDGLLGANREGILDAFAEVSPAIRPPEGVIFTVQPPPIGHQIIAFVEPPEDAKQAHFEIVYEFMPVAGHEERYLLAVTVEIREAIDGEPVASYSKELSTYEGYENLNGAIAELRANLVKWMVGKAESNN